MAVTFCVKGDPVPQPRPRVSTVGGFARAYVPADHQIHAYRAAVESAAKAAGLSPTGKPIAVEIDAVFQRPKSHWNKSGLKPTAPVLPRPDVDNIAKGCLDSLKKLIGDDTLVASLFVKKSYGEEARTTVAVS